jgi:adenine-specific DNA-methyltransferase
VLQETVVVSYRRAPLTGPVTIHQSLGLDDLQHASTVRAPRELVVHEPDHDCIISLPTTEEDVALLHDMRGQPTRLQDLGLSVSTGPVVPFRTDALVAPGPSAAPLLWLQHVTDQITWPLKDFSKPQGICLDADAKLLLPNETYVVLRRFSAKGDARRITAAVYEEGQLPGPWLGLENHLNYVHAQGRGLPLELAHGLATYLTTDAVERYFAVSSGNTQVSAAELRALPLPTEAVLRARGRARLARHTPQTPVMHTATKT